MSCIKDQAIRAIVEPNEELPYPRINLSNSEDIRREMAKIYREARSQRMLSNDATKLIYILTQILKAHEVFFIEQKLVALESRYLESTR